MPKERSTESTRSPAGSRWPSAGRLSALLASVWLLTSCASSTPPPVVIEPRQTTVPAGMLTLPEIVGTLPGGDASAQDVAQWIETVAARFRALADVIRARPDVFEVKE